MRKSLIGAAGLALLVIALGAGGAAAQSGSGWITVEPGGNTICSQGGPYRFFVREGASDNLLVYFQGGGGCWSGTTCAFKFYDPEVGPDDDPTANATGIFDLANPDNPFREYDMVFVPYCTGDVHTGDRVVEYDAGNNATLTIHHKGVANTGAALAYAYEHFTQPESVFVTGCSGGSLGAIFHTPFIIEQYPNARIAQLGDSAGGYRGGSADVLSAWGTVDNFPAWIAGFRGLTPESFSFEVVYNAPAEAYPDVTFAQINTADDKTQAVFVNVVRLLPYQEALAVNLAEMQSRPNFRFYTSWGSTHCLIPRPDFYTVQVNGIRLRDWVAALAAGDPVDNVQCTDCVTEERASPGS